MQKKGNTGKKHTVSNDSSCSNLCKKNQVNLMDN